MEKERYERVKRKAVAILLATFTICAFLLSFSGWQGWLYLAVLFIPLVFVGGYMLKYEPELLERRMQYREKEGFQQKIITVAGIIFVAEIAAIALDRHYGWSDVPVWLVLAADAATLAGYAIDFWAFKANPWASRIIEVASGQSVVSTGPYAIIRHPMYAGGLIMTLVLPLALGTWYPAAIFAFYAVAMAYRIGHEEKFLEANLPGYGDYCLKVKYRLIPGIW